MQRITVTAIALPPLQAIPPENQNLSCSEPTSPSRCGFPTVINNCGRTMSIPGGQALQPVGSLCPGGMMAQACPNAPPVITYTDTIVAKTCDYTYTINRTWTVCDGCQPAICVSVYQLVFVKDNQPPTLMLPANITIGCQQATSPGVTGTATAVDLCDPHPMVSYADIVVNNATCNRTILRTWTAKGTLRFSNMQRQFALTIIVRDRRMQQCGYGRAANPRAGHCSAHPDSAAEPHRAVSRFYQPQCNRCAERVYHLVLSR